MEVAEIALISAVTALETTVAELKTIVFTLKIEEIRLISFVAVGETVETEAALEALEAVFS
jgi:acyl dehydratase